MRKRTGLVVGIALIPAAAGLVIASLVTNVATLGNPIFYVRADLGSVALIIGLGLSTLMATGLALWQWQEQRHQQRVAEVRVQMADERRRFLQRLDHELKNPLTAIRAALANVVNDSDTAAQAQALASVEAQVLRLSRLTADMR